MYLIQPVGVQHAQGTAAACRTLLRDGAQVAGELQLLHTLVHGLTVADTLRERKKGGACRGAQEKFVRITYDGREGVRTESSSLKQRGGNGAL